MSETFIHSSALIEDDVVIGNGTKIWVNSQVRKGAKIGDNCIISKDTFIDTDVSIGNRCKIQNSVSVYHGVTIGDDVFVGPNVSFTNDKVPRAFAQDWKITPTFVDNGASLGANSTIVCGVTIGKYAMVAAGSVVTKDVEPYSLVMGSPAKHYSYVDKMGNKVEEN
jgi:UDP-2-acetamido-3-amino-2,3-dideoxy-glucuronate N-acetyltransferase